MPPHLPLPLYSKGSWVPPCRTLELLSLLLEPHRAIKVLHCRNLTSSTTSYQNLNRRRRRKALGTPFKNRKFISRTVTRRIRRWSWWGWGESRRGMRNEWRAATRRMRRWWWGWENGRGMNRWREIARMIRRRETKRRRQKDKEK